MKQLKTCAKCKTPKHLNAFPTDKTRADGRFSYCKICHRAYQSIWKIDNPLQSEERYLRSLAKARAWRELHPKEYQANVRRTSLLRRYGITPEQYGQKLEEQGGHCALCDKTPEQEAHGVLSIDHDHACCHRKKGCGLCFRSLLCFNHNVMLGVAHDNPSVLIAAANMLKEWNKTRCDRSVDDRCKTI